MDEGLDLEALQKESTRGLLTLDQFRTAALTGAFKPVVLKAAGVHFMIQGQVRKGGRMTLGTTRTKRDRRFRNPGSALALLHKMGLFEVEIELEGWHPTHEKEWREKRPDMADRLGFAHSVARDGSWEKEVTRFRRVRRYGSGRRLK